jgi:5-methylcytosine-specific restriction endonuclease McrA
MALSKDALGSGKWKQMRLRVLARDGWVCTYCHKHLEGADATVDHITSRKQGGSLFDMDNLTSACKSCNSSKGSLFFRGVSTPPVSQGVSLPETQVTRPLSPFQKP